MSPRPIISAALAMLVAGCGTTQSTPTPRDLSIASPGGVAKDSYSTTGLMAGSVM